MAKVKVTKKDYIKYMKKLETTEGDSWKEVALDAAFKTKLGNTLSGVCENIPVLFVVGGLNKKPDLLPLLFESKSDLQSFIKSKPRIFFDKYLGMKKRDLIAGFLHKEDPESTVLEFRVKKSLATGAIELKGSNLNKLETFLGSALGMSLNSFDEEGDDNAISEFQQAYERLLKGGQVLCGSEGFDGLEDLGDEAKMKILGAKAKLRDAFKNCLEWEDAEKAQLMDDPDTKAKYEQVETWKEALGDMFKELQAQGVDEADTDSLDDPLENFKGRLGNIQNQIKRFNIEKGDFIEELKSTYGKWVMSKDTKKEKIKELQDIVFDAHGSYKHLRKEYTDLLKSSFGDVSDEQAQQYSDFCKKRIQEMHTLITNAQKELKKLAGQVLQVSEEQLGDSELCIDFGNLADEVYLLNGDEDSETLEGYIEALQELEDRLIGQEGKDLKKSNAKEFKKCQIAHDSLQRRLFEMIPEDALEEIIIQERDDVVVECADIILTIDGKELKPVPALQEIATIYTHLQLTQKKIDKIVAIKSSAIASIDGMSDLVDSTKENLQKLMVKSKDVVGKLKEYAAVANKIVGIMENDGDKEELPSVEDFEETWDDYRDVLDELVELAGEVMN